MKLREAAPQSGLGRFTLYLLVVGLFLYFVQNVQALVRPSGEGSLQGWIVFLTTLLAVLGLILGFRWLRERLLWRLRNRLIVTYVFIGVIPVLLIATIAVGTAYLFGGQFATYLATSDIQAELKSLEAANATIAAEMAHGVRKSEFREVAPALRAPAQVGERWKNRAVTMWYRGRSTRIEGPEEAPPLPRPAWLEQDFSGVVFDATGVYLRVASTVAVGNEKLTVVSSMPLDAGSLPEITGNLGEISLSDITVEEGPASKPGLTIRSPSEEDRSQLVTGDELRQAGGGGLPSVSGGTMPAPRNRLDADLRFLSLFPMTDWSNGQALTKGLVVRTRVSALYDRLFRTLGTLTAVILYVLLGTAIFFGVIELVALFIGVGLTRTITRSVHELYQATQRINRGDLRHRIEVRSNDQLASLMTSFNSMTESLEGLIAEQKEKERLQNELAIAQEVQAQLFPRLPEEVESLEVFGFCRPARTVSGDYYDFLPFGPEKLGIAVGDISGKGISAALLMATLHSAVRAYEYGRIPAMRGHLVAAGRANGPTHVMEVTSGAPPDGDFSPAHVLTLLNRHLYLSTPTEKYATLFLGRYDGASRTLTYANAGHLPPLLIGEDDSIRRLDTPGLVIGLFDDQNYEERQVRMNPGDIFVAFSDGITEPENEFGEFGEGRLLEIIRDHRHLPLERVAEMVTGAVMEWIGANEQPDDITLVLARPR